MSKQVDHASRRREALRKALHLFAEIGYQQVTYQQLADVCGLPRTALYKYFKTKKEILDNAINQLMLDLNDEISTTLVREPNLDSKGKLELIVNTAVEACLKNPALLRAIVEYLIAQRRQGESVERKIKRHTIGFQLNIKNIVQDGIERREFKPVSPMMTADIFFCLMEAAVMHIMFYDDIDKKSLVSHCNYLIHSLMKEKADGGQE